MPRRRKYNLIRREAYERSAATRRGLLLGLPLPARLTSPPAINCSNSGASWHSPGVSTYVIGLPLPSHRTCTLVLNPPLLLPKASITGSPFLPRLRADEHVSRSYLRSGFPTLSRLWYQRLSATQPTACPICLVDANDRNEKKRFSRSRAVPLRHISPGSAGLAYPHDAIYDCAMVQ